MFSSDDGELDSSGSGSAPSGGGTDGHWESGGLRARFAVGEGLVAVGLLACAGQGGSFLFTICDWALNVQQSEK